MLGRKGLPGKNTLAFWLNLYVTIEKCFVNTTPELVLYFLRPQRTLQCVKIQLHSGENHSKLDLVLFKEQKYILHV
jgi:hypothetical protein